MVKDNKINLNSLGFFRAAAAAPELQVANCDFNTAQIKKNLTSLDAKKVQLVVFPELSISSYSCADLFFQPKLINSALKSLFDLKNFSKTIKSLFIVGVPLEFNNRLYNCAALIGNDTIYGIVPKTFLPNNREFYEQRWFSSGLGIVNQKITIADCVIDFGCDLIFTDKDYPEFKLAIEICEDLWTATPPSVGYSLSGASLIANLSASDVIVGKSDDVEEMVRVHSRKCLNCYIYSGASASESSTDMLFGGQKLMVQLGSTLASSDIHQEKDFIISDFDLDAVNYFRLRDTSFKQQMPHIACKNIAIKLCTAPDVEDLQNSTIRKNPFIPEKFTARRYEEILKITTLALIKRLQHIKSQSIILGLSGGLDSSLVLLLCLEAIKRYPCQLIVVSMPSFGTSNETLSNIKGLVEKLKLNLITIDIADDCQKLLDKLQAKNNLIVVENLQARIRTNILMNLANKHSGIVVGTSDLSETALGFSTFNGDQMSMYHLISGIPKTLVREMLIYFKEKEEYQAARNTIDGILKTPISPELLPTKDKIIAQKTEDIIGSYDIHDFILYYMLHYGYGPKKIYYLATLKSIAEKAEIKKVLKIFYTRFFANQFKRSAMPDGVKIGSIALSPRSDWRMPSDASAEIWLQELSEI